MLQLNSKCIFLNVSKAQEQLTSLIKLQNFAFPRRIIMNKTTQSMIFTFKQIVIKRLLSKKLYRADNTFWDFFIFYFINVTLTANTVQILSQYFCKTYTRDIFHLHEIFFEGNSNLRFPNRSTQLYHFV